MNGLGYHIYGGQLGPRDLYGGMVFDFMGASLEPRAAEVGLALGRARA